MRLGLMLAKRVDMLPEGSEWIHEPKVNGFRVLAGKEQGRVFLRTRSGLEVSASYPEVTEVLRELPFDDVVLDGELAVHDAHGRPDADLIRRHRAGKTGIIRVGWAAKHYPACIYAFDALVVTDDIRASSWDARNAALASFLGPDGPLRYLPHVRGAEAGQELFEAICRTENEGVVSKLVTSPYQTGRPGTWTKCYRLAEQRDYEEGAA